MRNTRFIASFAALLILMTTVGVSNVFAASLPPSLKARYDGLVKAIQKRDLTAFDKFYSADYVSVDPTGKSSGRAEYMAGMKALLKDATKVTTHVKYLSCKIRNGIAEVEFDFEGKITKPSGVTIFREVGTDTWKKSGNVWMEIKTVDKQSDVVEPKPHPVAHRDHSLKGNTRQQIAKNS